MSMHECIFSGERFYVISRHVAFWIVISSFFFLQSIVPGIDIYFTALVSLICFLPASIFVTYVCIYILLPKFIQKKKYLEFGLCYGLTILLALVINLPATYLFLELARGFVISREGHIQEGLAMVNTSHAIVISGLGLGIKFTKNWYQQQKENAKLSRQKIAAELQLAKAKVYPRFLFQSLDRLRSDIKAGSDDAPALLLRISDLLSYILYESREPEVPLQFELEMLQKRIEIENASRNGQLIFEFHLVGNPINKQIAPLASFAFFEECIKRLEKENRNKLEVILEVNSDNRLEPRLGDGEVILYKTSIPIRNEAINKDARASMENNYASYERL